MGKGIINYDAATTNELLAYVQEIKEGGGINPDAPKDGNLYGQKDGEWAKAQEQLESGKNIKTLNGVSVLGEGNIDVAPTIGENGNWFINGEDTGKPANGKDGADGVSLGEIALVQETGTGTGSENKVMSQAAVTRELTELSKQANRIQNNSVKEDNDSQTYVKDSSDKYYVTDKNGNIVAEISNEGLKAIRFLNKSGKDIEELISQKADKDIEAIIKNTESTNDSLYITDENGYVIAIINKDGIEVTSIKSKSGGEAIPPESSYNGWLKDKTIYTICDSLGVEGTWAEELANLSGAVFDKGINNDNDYPLSYGGTNTCTGYKANGMQRARNLVEYWVKTKGKKVDVLFIENINDLQKAYGYVKSISKIEDDDFFENQTINYFETIFNSSSEAYEYLKEHLNEIASTPQIGTVINSIYKDASRTSVKIIVSSAAKADGTLTLNVGGRQYSCSISAQDDIQAILRKIEEWDYVGYNDILDSSSNAISFVADSGNASVRIENNDTGAEITTENVEYSLSYATMAFTSKNIEDFYVKEKWNTNVYFYLNLYRCYKGLLSYLTKNLPETKIYWVMPTRFIMNWNQPDSKYVYQDGNFNHYAYYKKPENYTGSQDDGGPGGQYDALCDMQKEVCNMFGIEYIDINKKIGITLSNASTYYNSNNVHPKTDTYKFWGKFIFETIK
ncbi:hypothetical protein [Phocaeicola plebeius]